MLFFFNLYVGFNLNYIVVTHECFSDDYLSGELVVLSQQGIENIVSPCQVLSYWRKSWCCANCSKAFDWASLSCVPLSVVFILQSLIEKYSSAIGFPIFIGLIFNSVKGFVNFSVCYSGGRYRFANNVVCEKIVKIAVTNNINKNSKQLWRVYDWQQMGT